MKFIEFIGIFGAMATLVACDSSAPQANSVAIEARQAKAKLDEAGPRSAPAPVDSHARVKAEDRVNDPVEARLTPDYDRCLSTGEAGQGVTVAMVACNAAEAAAQDRALNAAYRTTLAGLEPGQRAKLVQAQRAWIVYRDAKCASENQTGGTVDSIGIGGCILRETARRTIELEAMRQAN
jgi:uncharacterized protein YecT (DUF1311 family)